MSLDHLVGPAIVAAFAIMLVVELTAPARTFDTTRGWVAIGIAFFLITIGISTFLPALVPIAWVQRRALIDGTGLGIAGGFILGILLGILAATFTDYWVHRAEHKFNFLWRWVHQMHHSPARVDVPGSVYFHPFDIVVFTSEGILLNLFVLGLDPRAVALVGYAGIFMAIFQPWNIRTPYWLGFIIQRPEAHYRHHERDVHAFNYANIPLWDILFGTFYNPHEVPADLTGRTGFDDNRRSRFLAMLFGRDVHADTPAFTHFDRYADSRVVPPA